MNIKLLTSEDKDWRTSEPSPGRGGLILENTAKEKHRQAGTPPELYSQLLSLILELDSYSKR
jgi:hypothetical protein